MDDTTAIVSVSALSVPMVLLAGMAWYMYFNEEDSVGNSSSPSASLTTTTTALGTLAGNATTSKQRIVAPYLLVADSKSNGLIGTKTPMVHLAFVVGYENGKIRWDSGSLQASSKTKGCIVSFGGQSAGKRGSPYFGELAGKFSDPAKLADAYIKISDTIGTTWLDFDVEEDAVKDSKSIQLRHKALALVSQKRPDIKLIFTVPVELTGLDNDTKGMLTDAKAKGVKISVISIMTMYISEKKIDMAEAALKCVESAKPFIKGLGASIGIIPQIGKNPDAPYTNENFTLANASQLVARAKADPDVVLLAYWNLNNDVKSYGGRYADAFKKFL